MLACACPPTQAVVLGEECPRAKPFPDPYEAGLARIGLAGRPQDALVRVCSPKRVHAARAHLLSSRPFQFPSQVLEDSPSGIKAAVAAGIPTVGLTTGQSAEALQAAGARLVVAHFDELMDLIEGRQ